MDSECNDNFKPKTRTNYKRKINEIIEESKAYPV